MGRNSRWLVFAPVALIAFFTGQVSASGFGDDFSDLSDWATVANGGNGVLADGQLKFSYGWGEVSRSVLVAEPSVVTLTVNVWNEATNSIGWSNPTVDEYRVSLGSAVATGNVAHGWLEIVLVHETLEPNETVVISLGGVDRGFWAGWYGPVMDDLNVLVEQTAPTTTTTSSVLQIPTTQPATTSSTQTTSVAIVEPQPAPPPPDTQTSVETIAPTTSLEPTTTVAQTTTTEAQTTTTQTPTTTTSETLPPVTEPSVTTPEAVPAETVTDEVSAPPAEASETEKEAFEAQVDVFSGEFDDYVPAGSKITVAQRRTVVAATAILIMFAPPPTRARRK